MAAVNMIPAFKLDIPKNLLDGKIITKLSTGTTLHQEFSIVRKYRPIDFTKDVIIETTDLAQIIHCNGFNGDAIEIRTSSPCDIELIAEDTLLLTNTVEQDIHLQWKMVDQVYWRKVEPPLSGVNELEVYLRRRGHCPNFEFYKVLS